MDHQPSGSIKKSENKRKVLGRAIPMQQGALELARRNIYKAKQKGERASNIGTADDPVLFSGSTNEKSVNDLN